MAALDDFVDIVFNGPLNSIGCFFEKLCSQKFFCQGSTMGGDKITNKVFSHRILYHKIFACKSQEFLGNQTLLTVVSIGAQHSHLHQVLLPILLPTPFVAASLLLARSLTEFLPYPTGTFDFVSSRQYGYKPNFSKSVILSMSDSRSGKGRDGLEDILPNKMIRKTNLILLLIVR